MGADWMYLVTAVVVGIGFALLLIVLMAWEAVKWLGEIVLSPVIPAARRAREARAARRQKEREGFEERSRQRLQEIQDRSRVNREWKWPPTV